MSDLPNIVAIARREYLVRVRTRSFIAGTVLVMLAVAAIAFVPVIGRIVEGTATTRIGVYVGVPDLATDPVPTLSALLNATAAGSTSSGPAISEKNATPSRFVVARVADLSSGRAEAQSGKTGALLAIERPSAGADLRFTLYTNDPTTRTAQLIQQASTAIAISDRLARAGVAPTAQGGIFAPPTFATAYPDPTRAGAPKSAIEAGTDYFLGFGMTILVFMMVILYGNWVGASVVEEKSSRVMEVILNAATPFQLLAGKVLGVGAVALTQYVLLVVVGVVAIAVQGPVADIILGSSGGSVSLPAGLSVASLLILAVYGILGFLIYAVLFAAAGSLVSRQEDLQQVVMPMTLLATAGYMVGVYSATGMLDLRAGWNAVLAQIPFFSPFTMITRWMAGAAGLPEILLSVAILVISIVAALWLAARVYAVGVLLYGQRPAVRTIWRLLREGI